MGNGINIDSELLEGILEHQYSLLSGPLNASQKINKEKHKDFVSEWVYLMNRPTQLNPYGTDYTFKEMYEKYAIPYNLKEKD